jgi:hypothetical protein
MSVVAPSEAISQLMRSASGPVFIAAPYIKSPTLRKLIADLPAAATELICITRWLPEDIAAGACDLKILEDVTSRDGGRLLVHPHLHAKYYRAASQCWVTANLTARARLDNTGQH